MDVEEQVAQPKWLIELENRTRKPRLAHEAGAGSPCLSCKSACPGLDLHFWRKICKKCKCSRGEHDICDDDFPQFDLIFGKNSKLKTSPQRLRINITGQPDEPLFEWVPPNTNKELAEGYMKHLPLTHVPIKGTAGAIMRKKLLQKQIPLHDIDYQNCNKLSDKEKTEFQQYLEKLKNSAGHGKIVKFVSRDEFMKAQQDPTYENSKSQYILAPFNLQTPSQFQNTKSIAPTGCAKSTIKTAAKNFPVWTTRPDMNAIYSNSVKGRYYCNFLKDEYEDSIANSTKVKIANRGVVGAVKNVTDPEKRIEFSSTANTAEKMFNKDLKAREVPQNDIVGSTLDKDKLQFIREKLQLKYANSEEPHLATVSMSTKISNPNGGAKTNVNSPAHLVKDKLTVINSSIEEGNHLQPNSNTLLINSNNSQVNSNNLQINSNNLQSNGNNSPINDNKNRSSDPAIQSINAELDKMSIIGNQLSSVETNNPVFPEYSVNKVCQHSVPADNCEMCEKYCRKCEKQLQLGDVVVTAEKAGEAYWHPSCFVCNICEEILVDMVYFCHKQKVYCARHYAYSLKIPRCYACDELIFVRGYTVAEGHEYHIEHFCCWKCDKPLAGQQYTLEKNQPLCLPCYDENYARICYTCEKIIAVNQQGVSADNLNFHVDSECFCCYECKNSLHDSRIIIKESKPFCSKECAVKCLNA